MKPLWRIWKWLGVGLFLTALAGWLWCAATAFQYQQSLPRHPEPEAGRVYPLNVHGIVVYQTRYERDRLDHSFYASIAAVAVSGILAAFYQKKFRRPPSPPSMRFGR